jgi:hypothetical protein
MQDHENRVPIEHERIAWNKGRLIGAKPPYGQSMSGQFEPSSSSRDARANWRCLIRRSTANCGVAMSSRSRSRTLHRMGRPSNGPPEEDWPAGSF